MNRKLLFLLVMLIAVLGVVSVASAQELFRIWGWAYNGDVVDVSTSDDAYFSVRWGTCTKGLTTAWTKRAYVVYTVDGEPVTSSKKATRSYWSKPFPLDEHWGIPFCINNTDVIWMAYWDYPIDLDVGTYEITFEYGIDPPFSDGVDCDTDGIECHPDGYRDMHGHLFSTEFTLNVTD